MKCPTINNEFQFARKVLGTEVLFASMKANGDQPLEIAPNGKPSVFYARLYAITGSHEHALKLKSAMLTPKSKNWKGGNADITTDINGEPKIFYYTSPETLSSSFANSKMKFLLEKPIEGVLSVPVILKNGTSIDIIDKNGIIDASKIKNKKFDYYRSSTRILGSSGGAVYLNTDTSENIMPLMEPTMYDSYEQKPIVKDKAYVNELGKVILDTRLNVAKNYPTEFKKAADKNPRYDNAPNGDFNEHLNNSDNIKLANLLVKAIQKTFPGVEFAYETNDSSMEKFGRVQEGWVEDGVIHINRESINPETGIHELGHILEPLLATHSPDEHKAIMTEIQNELDNKSGFFYSLKVKLYGDRVVEKKELMNELFAEGLAVKTLKQVEAKLRESGDHKTEPTGVYKRILNLFSKVKSIVSSLFSTSFGKNVETMEDLGMSLAEDLLGANVYNFTNEDSEFLRTHFLNEGVMFRNAEHNSSKASIVLDNIEDINNFMMGNAKQQQEPLQVAERMAARYLRNVKGKKIEIKSRGKTFTYPSNIRLNKLTAKIYKDITKPSFELKDKIKDGIVSSINPKKRNDAELNNLLGEYTTKESVNTLKFALGLNNAVVGVHKYSDLKDSDNPLLSQLYDETLVGKDPLVIVHSSSIEDGLSVSIVDVTPYRIYKSYESNKGRNIFSEMGVNDNEYYNSQGVDGLKKKSLLISDVDFRTFNITMLVSHMQDKLGDKIRFNNLGVVNPTTRKTHVKMITNVNHVKQNLHVFSNIPGMKTGMLSGRVKEIVENEAIIKEAVKVSHFDELKAYLYDVKMGVIQDEHLEFYASNILTKLEDNELGSVISVLEGIKSHLHTFSSPDKAINSHAYMLTVKASREVTTGKTVLLNDLDDISGLGKNLTTAYQQKNDYAQDVIEATHKTTFTVTDKVMDDFKKVGGTTSNPGLARKVMKRIFSKNLLLKAKRYIADTGSDIYAHMYKTQEVYVADENGDLVKGDDGALLTRKVKIPEIHHDINDAQTKQALKEGTIDLQDIEFGAKVIETLKHRWVEYYVHKANVQRANVSSQESEYSYEDGVEEYEKVFGKKGVVPAFGKSASELLFQGDLKKASSKHFKEIEHSEALFEDAIEVRDENSSVFSRMSDHITSQTDEDNRLGQAGLKYIKVDGRVVLAVTNDVKNEDMSTDLWKVFSFTDHTLIRNVEYEKNVLPIARNAVSLLQQLGPTSQKNNLNYIEEYVNKIVFRKNADEKLNISLPFDANVNIGVLARSVKGLFNAAVLPFKFSIGVASIMFNINSLIKHSLASTISGDKTGMPSLKSFTAAAKLSLNPKKFKKLRELSLKMHVWGRDETSITSSPWVNVTDHFVFNQMFTNILNWSTDTWARSITMAAVMIEDGSYDAFSYDEKTGELSYDETKDKRFYDKDGNRLENKESIALFEAVKKDVDVTYDIDPDKVRLAFGYGSTDANYMKTLAETKIIGAFDKNGAALVGNNWLGNMLSHFRSFAPTRLFHAGILADERFTNVGQRIITEEDENGNVIGKVEAKRIVGELQSFTKAVNELKQANNFSLEEIKNWYAEAPTEHKTNLLRSLMTVMQFVIVAGLYGMFGDDDDEYNKLSWTYWMNRYLQDITIMTTVVDVFTDPFPAIEMTMNIVEKGGYYKVLPYSGALDEVVKTIDNFNEEEK